MHNISRFESLKIKTFFMTRRITLLSLLIILFCSATLSSCMKFEGEQTVPAYIRIDTIGLTCDYYTYGANTHNFVDVWVYVDDDLRGCFELPTTVPILKQGPHKIAVYAGIAVNGIKDTRADYPFTAPAVYRDVNLVPDSVITLIPMVTYWPAGPDENTHVRWVEDFDSGTVTIETTSQSDVPLLRVSGPLAWHDPEGVHSTYSAKLVLNSDTTQFCIANTEELSDLPRKGSPCMLEMDYKCSDTCTVGIFYRLNYTVTQEALVRLKPTGALGEEPVEWKKIYINLGPYFVDYEDADYFKVYLSSWFNRNDGPQYFYFDNLKIIYNDR